MKKKEETIDFSLLNDLNIPEIPLTPTEEVKLTELETETIKGSVIDEVNNIEEFGKGIPDPNADETKDKSKESTTADLDESGETVEETENKDESDISVIKGISEWAKAEGIFDYTDEEFQDSPEFIKNKIEQISEQKAEKRTQEKLAEYPEVIHELAKNYKDGVPLDELIYSKSREIEYNQITEKTLEENKELQKQVLGDWLANQEYTEDEIKQKLQKYEDAVILEDEAKTALVKLKIFEKKYQEKLVQDAKQKQEQEKKDFEDKIKGIESDIMGSDEIIPGIKLTPEEKKKIFEAYTKADGKGITQLINEIKSDPKAWYKITQFLVLMKGNLESVKTKLSTEATNKVKETVNTYVDTSPLGKINIKKMKKAIEIAKKQR